MLHYRVYHTRPQANNNNNNNNNNKYNNNVGAKSDWDFRIFDLVKNSDGTDI